VALLAKYLAKDHHGEGKCGNESNDSDIYCGSLILLQINYDFWYFVLSSVTYCSIF
jgi:hypothetical protein